MIDWVKGQISQTATADGVDPALDLAVASIEGNFDPNAVGDTNTAYPSYGTFQERIVVGRGGLTTPDTDPAHQAHRFDLDVLAYKAAGGSGSPGQIAAAVQRPGDPAGYAAKVDARYQTFIGGSSDPHSPPPQGQPGGGGFEPTFPGLTYDPATGTYRASKPGDKPAAQNSPADIAANIGGAITAGVDSLKTGAVKFAIAALVVGVVAVLGFGGLKETFD